MRCIRAGLLVGSACLGACAGLPSGDLPATRVSSDYMSTAPGGRVRAFVYGKRTVLVVPGGSIWLTVRDADGAAVGYEREGDYYRLSRRLDTFTVWVNLRQVVFAAAPLGAPAPALIPAAPARLAPLPAVKLRVEPPAPHSDAGRQEVHPSARRAQAMVAAQLD